MRNYRSELKVKISRGSITQAHVQVDSLSVSRPLSRSAAFTGSQRSLADHLRLPFAQLFAADHAQFDVVRAAGDLADETARVHRRAVVISQRKNHQCRNSPRPGREKKTAISLIAAANCVPDRRRSS